MLREGSKNLSRRAFLKGMALAGAGTALAACEPKVVTVTEEKVVQETVIVEGTPQVVEKVITATPPPAERVSILATINHSLEVYDPLAYELADERLPNIDLVVDTTSAQGGWDAYADNLITRIAGGEPVDIVYMAIEGMPLLTEKRAIRTLSPFLEADMEAQEELEDDIHPTLWDVLTWKGERMLIPYGFNNMLTWYNPAIFEELGMPEPEDGWNWEDFVDVCLQVADVQGTVEDRYAFSWFDSAFGMAPWYFNNDTSWLKNDWQDSNLDDPKVAETLQFLADLIHEHQVSPQLAGWDEAGQFHSGHLAMRGCGRWCVGQAKNAEFTSYNFDYYPHNAGPLKTVVGVGGWGIVTMSQHPDEAWQAIVQVLGSYEMDLKFINTVGSVAARRSVVETEDFQSGPPGVDMGIFYASLDYADVVPSPPNFNLVDPLLRRYYGQLWNGEISVDELVSAAHEELQAEMDKIKE